MYSLLGFRLLKVLLVTNLFLLTISVLHAQSFKQTDKVIVLENENNLIPIQDLTECKMASIWIGGLDKGRSFNKMLSKYALVKHFYFHDKNEAFLKRMRTQLQEEFNTVFITLDSSVNTAIIEKAKLWLSTIEISNIIITAPTDLIDKAQSIASSSSIISYDSTNYNFVPQVIFGGLGANGKLQEAIGDFPKGAGIVTQSIGRLSYVDASSIGVNKERLHFKIDSVCTTAIDLGAFPGCQVMGVYKGQVFFHKTYGYHTYEQERTVKPDDLYDMASVSKVSTALPALMKFHGEGRFDLEKTMGDYFSFLKSSNKKALVMREVLAHQARLKPWIPYWQSTLKDDGSFKPKTLQSTYSKRFPIKLTDNLFLHRKYREKKIYKAIKKSPLLEKKEYVYSGLSFYLFPELVENISGQGYESYLKKTFYEPLGAYRLTFNPLRFWPKSKIIPTENDDFFRKQQLHGIVHDEGAAMMNGLSANAGLFGTADDLAKLFQMYLQMGEFGGKRFIAEESLREFTKYQFEGNRRGLGFDKPVLENKENGSVSVLASDSSFGHSGYTGTFVWVDPEKEFIFIFLSNRVYPTRDNRIIYQKNIRPTLNHIFYEALEKL